jgi:hypothetical protein
MSTEIPGYEEAGPGDARLEALLRADAARDAQVDDSGFSARVLAVLPAPRPQRSYRWLGPALGGLAAAGLAAFSPLTHELLAPVRSVASGHVHALHPQSLLVFVPLVVLAYVGAWFAATDST